MNDHRANTHYYILATTTPALFLECLDPYWIIFRDKEITNTKLIFGPCVICYALYHKIFYNKTFKKF